MSGQDHSVKEGNGKSRYWGTPFAGPAKGGGLKSGRGGEGSLRKELQEII